MDNKPQWNLIDDPLVPGDICLYIKGVIFALSREDMYKLGETLIDLSKPGKSLPASVSRSDCQGEKGDG